MNGLIRRKHTILVFFTAPLLASFVLFDGAVAVVPPPDGDYPGGNTAEGQNGFLALRPADSIRRLVSFHSGVIQSAVSTRRLARELSWLIPQTTIPPPVRERF
jgi:hypothetical protein